MKKSIHHILLITLLALFTACGEKEETTQQTDFNLKVEEQVEIMLPSSSSYTVTIGSPIVEYKLTQNRLTVTALKVGTTSVKVILDSGEERKYNFIISQNAYQGGYFTLNAKPRIEAWHLGETILTEETTGLQVTCEPGIGITGEEKTEETRSYGFIFLESGKLLRFSAEGNFTQPGELSEGIAAMRESSATPLQYEECKVTIAKVDSEGKIWFTLTFSNRSDIRIVTEKF